MDICVWPTYPLRNCPNFFFKKNMASTDPTYVRFGICLKFRSFFFWDPSLTYFSIHSNNFAAEYSPLIPWENNWESECSLAQTLLQTSNRCLIQRDATLFIILSIYIRGLFWTIIPVPGAHFSPARDCLIQSVKALCSRRCIEERAK